MSLIKPVSPAQSIGTPFAFRRSQLTNPHAPAAASIAHSQSATPERVADQADELEAMRGMISEMSVQLEAAKAEVKAARAEAHAEGYAQGQQDAATRENERLQLLKQALDDALLTLDRKLDRERDIAIELTIATLSSILADPQRQAALVAETSGRWADTLKSSKVLRVRVSAADFETPDAIALLSERLEGITVVVDQFLPSGSCLFDLDLGFVDASLHVQAAAAKGYLENNANTTDGGA